MTSESIKSASWKQILRDVTIITCPWRWSIAGHSIAWKSHLPAGGMSAVRYVQMTELQMVFLSSFQGGNIGLAVHWLVRYRVLCGRAQ